MSDPLELQKIVTQLCRDDFRSFAIRAFYALKGQCPPSAPMAQI